MYMYVLVYQLCYVVLHEARQDHLVEEVERGDREQDDLFLLRARTNDPHESRPHQREGAPRILKPKSPLGTNLTTSRRAGRPRVTMQ